MVSQADNKTVHISITFLSPLYSYNLIANSAEQWHRQLYQQTCDRRTSEAHKKANIMQQVLCNASQALPLAHSMKTLPDVHAGQRKMSLIIRNSVKRLY